MNPRRLVLLAILLAAPLGAAEQSGRPLLELEGRGTRVTFLHLPFCGPGCLEPRDPRFVSYRLQVLHDGAVHATFTENRLGDSEPAVSRVIDGRGPGAAFADLRAQLVAARIGQAAGGCWTTLRLDPPSGRAEEVDGASLTYRIVWFGAGDRTQQLDLPHEGGTICPPQLRRVVQKAIDYTLAAAAAPSEAAADRTD